MHFRQNGFFQQEDKILIKNLWQLKGYTTTRFVREFKTKNWSRGGLDCLLAKIGRTGSVDRVADSGINDRLVKLCPLIDHTCFEFIDNTDKNLSNQVVEYLNVEYLIPQHYSIMWRHLSN